MSWKRYILAIMVAFLLATVLDILWNAIVLHDVFLQNARFWRPADELNALVPLGWLSTLLGMALTAAAFVLLGGSGLRSGLMFGLFLGLAGAIGTFGLATLVPWPMVLIAAMALQQFVNALILGLSLGSIYRAKEVRDG